MDAWSFLELLIKISYGFQMIVDWIKKILRFSKRSRFPDYEVVHVRSLSKRSADDSEVKSVHLSAFGRDMHLQLQRNDDFDERLKTMKMYLAESTNNGIQYREMPVEDNDPGTTYQDLDQMAAVTIRHGEDGNMQMEGTIGNDLVVKPVPTEILMPEDGFNDDEMFLDEEESYERNRNNSFYLSLIFYLWTTYAAILTVKPVVLPEQALFIELKRGVIATVWPEVLLLVDYASFVLHGRSSSQARRYYVSFWNGVDLRYKSLSNPKIKICLAGIIVAKSKEATPYLERNRLPLPTETQWTQPVPSLTWQSICTWNTVSQV
ncbi:a disintegrin and metalloproteinase with thrombospondin motifs 5 [Caerostris extrusa]|uniref:A disintegrin and metalloproteinase with thrombospondin motifs 5 n=1 Tax=Caerostris extrusa TaxID=172846 RepID=A0AAV4V1U4_CAEEX|nr:a disintegrin and metalloproteinase with thrombospondin motifs 5 [Caerostris extrusa]